MSKRAGENLLTLGTCEGLAGHGGWYTEWWGPEEGEGTGLDPGTLSLRAYKGDRYVTHLAVSPMIFSLFFFRSQLSIPTRSHSAFPNGRLLLSLPVYHRKGGVGLPAAHPSSSVSPLFFLEEAGSIHVASFPGTGSM